MTIKRALLVLTLIVCSGTAVFPLTMPPKADAYLNDYAALLDASDRGRLDARLREFEKQTSNQIVVAIFPSLEEESLEDFTNRLFEAWKIGQQNRDNGVLMTVFVKEKRVRIEVGYGLEGVLTDALSSRIIRDELVPQFRAQQYSAGIEEAITAIEKATRGEYKPIPQKETPRSGSYLPILMLVAFFILVNLLSRKQRRRQGWRQGHRRNDDWWIIPGGHWGSGGSGTGGSFGGGGGFGGGGFSGGGGSSGGGGASGGW